MGEEINTHTAAKRLLKYFALLSNLLQPLRYRYLGTCYAYQEVFRIRIGSGFNQVSWSGFKIRIQEGQHDPQKQKTNVLYKGLGISKLQFFIKKLSHIFLAVNFFQFFGIKTLDTDWIWIGISNGTYLFTKNDGSESGIDESGSETLLLREGDVARKVGGNVSSTERQYRIVFSATRD